MFGKYDSLFKRDKAGNTGLGEMFRGAADGASEQVREYFQSMKEMITSDSIEDKLFFAFFGVTAPMLLTMLPTMAAVDEASRALRDHHNKIATEALTKPSSSAHTPRN